MSTRLGTAVLAVVGGLLLLLAGAGVVWAKPRIESLFGAAPDYSGPGQGSVVVRVEDGDSSAAIGRTLKGKGVVKSVDAFTDAARSEPKSQGIQVGYHDADMSKA